MNQEIVTYSSNFRKNHSMVKVLKEIFSKVKKYKYQILLSIKKQIQTTYQQDTLGLLWAIIMPIIPMTVYIFLAHIKLFNSVDAMPFIFFIAIGMFIWLLMATTIKKVMLSIKRDSAILKTTDFPIIASMLSQLGGVLNDSLIRAFVVIAIISWYQVDLSLLSTLIVIFSFIPIILLAFSLGVIFAILDMLIQDTRRVVEVFLRYGLFVSSVIFPFPSDGILGSINNFNFFNTYVISIRDLLYFGTIENIELFIYTSIFSFLLFLIAMKLVYSMDYKIRAYL